MDWKVCAEVLNERRSEMIKRALIVFAIVELIVMVFAVVQVTHK